MILQREGELSQQLPPHTRRKPAATSTPTEDPLMEKVDSLHELITQRYKEPAGPPTDEGVVPETEHWARLMVRELSAVPRLQRLKFRNSVSNQLFELISKVTPPE